MTGIRLLCCVFLVLAFFNVIVEGKKDKKENQKHLRAEVEEEKKHHHESSKDEHSKKVGHACTQAAMAGLEYVDDSFTCGDRIRYDNGIEAISIPTGFHLFQGSKGLPRGTVPRTNTKKDPNSPALYNGEAFFSVRKTALLIYASNQQRYLHEFVASRDIIAFNPVDARNSALMVDALNNVHGVWDMDWGRAQEEAGKCPYRLAAHEKNPETTKKYMEEKKGIPTASATRRTLPFKEYTTVRKILGRKRSLPTLRNSRKYYGKLYRLAFGFDGKHPIGLSTEYDPFTNIDQRYSANELDHELMYAMCQVLTSWGLDGYVAPPAANQAPEVMLCNAPEVLTPVLIQAPVNQAPAPPAPPAPNVPAPPVPQQQVEEVVEDDDDVDVPFEQPPINDVKVEPLLTEEGDGKAIEEAIGTDEIIKEFEAITENHVVNPKALHDFALKNNPSLTDEDYQAALDEIESLADTNGDNILEDTEINAYVETYL